MFAISPHGRIPDNIATVGPFVKYPTRESDSVKPACKAGAVAVRRAGRGRALGPYHLFLSTSNPNANTVPPLVVVNCSSEMGHFGLEPKASVVSGLRSDQLS